MNQSMAPRPACASGRLAHLGLLRFAGPDAVGFLQGQLSNDTRRLSAGSPLLAAYSTPQGRVVAVLHLLPHSSGVIGLLPREILLPTLERLRKFVLRAKLQIEDVSGQFSVVGQHGASLLRAAGLGLPEASGGYVEQGGVGVGAVSVGADRYWTIGSTADLDKFGLLGRMDSEQVEHDWRLADIRAGIPQVYAATREMFVAQMLNLDLIDGISFTKGCFTGQEIVARTQHLGRIKRRLFRLRLPAGTWAIGQAVRLRDGRSGRLTELAKTADGVEALAVLTTESGAPVESAAPAAPGAAATLGAPAASASAAVDPDSAASPLIDATQLSLPYS